ncbi:MAG: DUF2887 domain-containing protein [Calothrix sp. SM1_7_51]|nr:DUF2887 domain-containing protein [Calothrix sp. SM1_7_51]
MTKISIDIVILFFELIDQSGQNPSIYEFSAPDIKQTSFHLDGLLLTRSRYRYKPIYFVEVGINTVE